LVFSDAIDGHDGLETERTIIFDDTEGLVSTRVIKRLEVYEQIGFDRAYVRDFDVRQPDLIIEGEEGDGGLEYYEFPADIVRAGAADTGTAGAGGGGEECPPPRVGSATVSRCNGVPCRGVCDGGECVCFDMLGGAIEGPTDSAALSLPVWRLDRRPPQ
jgi:hypothetical protein